MPKTNGKRRCLYCGNTRRGMAQQAMFDIWEPFCSKYHKERWDMENVVPKGERGYAMTVDDMLEDARRLQAAGYGSAVLRILGTVTMYRVSCVDGQNANIFANEPIRRVRDKP